MSHILHEVKCSLRGLYFTTVISYLSHYWEITRTVYHKWRIQSHTSFLDKPIKWNGLPRCTICNFFQILTCNYDVYNKLNNMQIQLCLRDKSFCNIITAYHLIIWSTRAYAQRHSIKQNYFLWVTGINLWMVTNWHISVINCHFLYVNHDSKTVYMTQIVLFH